MSHLGLGLSWPDATSWVQPTDGARTSSQGQPVAVNRPLIAVSCCVGRLLLRFRKIGIGPGKFQSQTVSPGRKLERLFFKRTSQPYSSKYIQVPPKGKESKLACGSPQLEFGVKPFRSSKHPSVFPPLLLPASSETHTSACLVG